METIDRPALVVALDGSLSGEQALTVADALAAVLAAQTHVVFATSRPFDEDVAATLLGLPADWRERAHLHLAQGDAVDAIIRVATELGAAAILLWSHGETGDIRAPAGHVTLGVLSAPPCPVYVVRSALTAEAQAHRIRHQRRVLLPLDGTADASAATKEACHIARVSQSRLSILHVASLDAPADARPRTPAYADHPHYEMEAWAEEFARASVGAADAPAGMDVALRVGAPDEEIVRYAQEEDCDLIVLAWGGRLSPTRARVVEALLRTAVCPLLFFRAGETATR